jgi:hypothetical protein
MTNALDFVAWQSRGHNKVVLAATCASSSSSLGYLSSGWDKGATSVKDEAASATVAAKFIVGKHINHNYLMENAS